MSAAPTSPVQGMPRLQPVRWMSEVTPGRPRFDARSEASAGPIDTSAPGRMLRGCCRSTESPDALMCRLCCGPLAGTTPLPICWHPLDTKQHLYPQPRPLHPCTDTAGICARPAGKGQATTRCASLSLACLMPAPSQLAEQSGEAHQEAVVCGGCIAVGLCRRLVHGAIGSRHGVLGGSHPLHRRLPVLHSLHELEARAELVIRTRAVNLHNAAGIRAPYSSESQSASKSELNRVLSPVGSSKPVRLAVCLQLPANADTDERVRDAHKRKDDAAVRCMP